MNSCNLHGKFVSVKLTLPTAEPNKHRAPHQISSRAQLMAAWAIVSTHRGDTFLTNIKVLFFLP